MKPFNLERFKAGEPAYCKNHSYRLSTSSKVQPDNLEYFYLAELPDGRIIVKFKIHSVWNATDCSHEFLNEWYYMKEKELTWDEVRIMWLNLDVGNVFQWLDENFELPKRKKNNYGTTDGS